jgi:hypothetical protein
VSEPQTKRIAEPGYYDLPLVDYLSDPCPTPSLSSKIVDALLNLSPMEAKQLSPRIGRKKVDASPRADIGSAVHALVNGGYPIVYGDYKDWRTDASKAWRDGARAEMQIPLLRFQQMAVECAANAARIALAKFGAGQYEQSMCWPIDTPEGVVWCRSRTDYKSDDGTIDIDIATAENVNPHEWTKHVAPNGKEQQASLRALGHEVLTGKPRKMAWLLVQFEYPYLVSIVGVGPRMAALHRASIQYVAPLWAKCLRDDKWPGYGDQIYWAEPQPWAEKNFAEKTGVVIE